MSRARLPQAPVAALTLTSFLLSLFAPCGSSASSGDESTAEVESVPVPAASLPSAGASATANANPGDPKAPEVLMSDQPKEISVSTEAPPIAPGPLLGQPPLKPCHSRLWVAAPSPSPLSHGNANWRA